MIDLYYEFDNLNAYLSAGRWTENKIREWCRENCSQYFLIDILGHNIRCSFVDEEDAVGFKLRWL